MCLGNGDRCPRSNVMFREPDKDYTSENTRRTKQRSIELMSFPSITDLRGRERRERAIKASHSHACGYTH